jgi:MscS family membrane protein
MLFKTMLALHTDTSQERLQAVISQIRTVLQDEPKIEKPSARVRLVELTAASINVELACYVLTTDFDEFATVREEVLMRIMNLVEDSGASLASSTPTVILKSEPEAQKENTNQRGR